MDKFVKLLIDGIETRLESVPDDDVYIAMSSETARELIETLKAKSEEQEAVEPVLDEQTGRIWLCGKCGSYVGFEDNDPHDPNEFDKYCRECGRPVLWEVTS